MSRRPATRWRCRRTTKGILCNSLNPPRTRKCQACGKPRPIRRRPAHLTILQIMDYAAFVKLNGSEHCGICGKPASPHRRLDRDHDHRTGRPRGLLCFACNRHLSIYMTIDWLEKALAYLKRAEGLR